MHIDIAIDIDIDYFNIISLMKIHVLIFSPLFRYCSPALCLLIAIEYFHISPFSLLMMIFTDYFHGIDYAVIDDHFSR